MKNFVLKITFLIIPSLLFSQSVLFNQSNSDLPEDDILSVAIDFNGNKWIGTSNKGLVLFDGNNFIPFSKEFFKMIQGDYITPIFVDSKKRIWISYSNPNDGITMLDGNTWYNFTEKELEEVSVIAIAEDENGVIYFGGTNGIITYENNKWNKMKLPSGNYTVRAIDIDKKGNIAIGHNEGLLLYQNKKWKNYTEENSELVLSTVRAVKFIENKIFIGYGGGLGNGGFSILENKKWQHFNKNNSSISDHMIRDIEVDQKGTIWMATNFGLIKFKDGIITPIFFNDGKYTNVITDISIDKETIWLSTTIGLIKYVP